MSFGNTGGAVMNSKETVAAKAHRYLTEGRVIVTLATPGCVNATVRGDADVHQVTYQRGGWNCTCPARGRCAHLLAVGLVTAPTTVRYGQPRATGIGRPRSVTTSQPRIAADGQSRSAARGQPSPIAGAQTQGWPRQTTGAQTRSVNGHPHAAVTN
jgi:hypothetical protein